MAIYTLPSGILPQSLVWGLSRNTVRSTSSFSGFTQTADLLGWRWKAELRMPGSLWGSKAGQLEALANVLAGGVDKLQLYRLDRPVPMGTMRGTPVLNGAHAQFANVLMLRSAGASATLLAGDFVGVGGDLLQVAAACTADGSGNITVPLVNRLRAARADGLAAVWDRPTANFAMNDTETALELTPGRRMSDFVLTFTEAI